MLKPREGSKGAGGQRRPRWSVGGRAPRSPSHHVLPLTVASQAQAGTCAALGYTYHLKGEVDAAVEHYHKARLSSCLSAETHMRLASSLCSAAVCPPSRRALTFLLPPAMPGDQPLHRPSIDASPPIRRRWACGPRTLSRQRCWQRRWRRAAPHSSSSCGSSRRRAKRDREGSDGAAGWAAVAGMLCQSLHCTAPDVKSLDNLGVQRRRGHSPAC